jgi:hypothetical protein
MISTNTSPLPPAQDSLPTTFRGVKNGMTFNQRLALAIFAPIFGVVLIMWIAHKNRRQVARVAARRRSA